MKQPTYHTTLPPQVRFDQKLPANAKLLYAEVKALCDQQGYCWASNQYLGSLYGVHRETISLWLRQLRERKLIRIQLIPEAGNQRRIYLNATDSELPQSYEKSQEEPGKTLTGPKDSSPPSCELIVPKSDPLLIEKYIDYNDRIHSDPLKNLSIDERKKKERNTPDGQWKNTPSNPPVAPHPPSWTRLPPSRSSPSVKFLKPLVKDAEDYMLSQPELCRDALTARAQALRFVNYYESNGWKVGRNAMQDWQAAANNWLLNAKDYADKVTGMPATGKSRNDVMSPDFDPYAPRLHSGGPKDYSIPL